MTTGGVVSGRGGLAYLSSVLFVPLLLSTAASASPYDAAESDAGPNEHAADGGAFSADESGLHAPTDGFYDGGVVDGGVVDGGEVNGGEVIGGEVIGGEVNGGEVNGGEVNGGEVNGGEVNVGVSDGGLIDFGFDMASESSTAVSGEEPSTEVSSSPEAARRPGREGPVATTPPSPFPPRHRGEILPPITSSDSAVATRGTLFLFADDLLGFGTLWDATKGDQSLLIGDDLSPRPEYGLHGHLIAYGRLPLDWPQVELDGALVAGLRVAGVDPATSLLTDISDDGSYVKASWLPMAAADSNSPRMTLTLFPLSSDRLRLGHLHQMSWGGDAIYPVARRMTPAVRVGFEWLGAYAFGAGKMITMVDEKTASLRPFGSVLAGVGVDLLDVFALETGGGWFSRGTSRSPDTAGEPVPAFGISSRAVLHLGRSAVIAPDLRVMHADLGTLELSRLGADEGPQINGLVALEHSWLGATVTSGEDPRETTLLPSQALALSGRLQLYTLSMALDAFVQEAAWQAVERFPSLGLVGPDVSSEAELFAGGSVMVRVPSLRCSFGVAGSFRLPPTSTLHNFGVDGENDSTVVLRSSGDLSILPDGEARGPILTLGLVGQADLGTMLSVLASVASTADGNATRFVDTEGQAGLSQRERVRTWGLPFRVNAASTVTAQLRF